MTQAIVESAIASEADMTVVGHSTNARLERAIRRCRANVVIVNERAVAGKLHLRIVGANPQVKVVAISDAGATASLYEFRAVRMADPSAASLVDVIRAALSGESSGGAVK
jgi:hypothetical protein